MEYEENSKWSTFWSWAFVFILSFSLIGWAMFMMTFVKDVPREWDFGNIEYTPAKSVYSSVQSSSESEKVDETEEILVAPLPDGVSMEEQNKTQN